LFAAGDYEKFCALCIEFEVLTYHIAQGVKLVDIGISFGANIEAVQTWRGIYNMKKGQAVRATEQMMARQDRYRKKYSED
jgi:hypothetical protein